MEEVPMLSPRFLIPVVAFATLAVLAGPVSSPEKKPLRTAPRNQISFQPSGHVAPEVDLRPEIEKLGLAVRDQGNRATCSVFATTFLIEYFEARAQGVKDLAFSEEYLN